MVIIEAMSHGLPVVASNVGGVSEIVHDGKSGYVVENRSEEFASKIESLLQDDKLYEAQSNEARRIYHDSLTVERMVQKYLSIYSNEA